MRVGRTDRVHEGRWVAPDAPASLHVWCAPSLWGKKESASGPLAPDDVPFPFYVEQLADDTRFKRRSTKVTQMSAPYLALVSK